MELIDKLNQMKTVLVKHNLDSLVDIVNETIEYIKTMPCDVAPTREDFFPFDVVPTLETKAEGPIQIYGGNFYFGVKFSEKIVDSIIKNKNSATEDAPPLVTDENVQKF